MKDFPAMYWIPKIHRNPISSGFIVASPVCSTKPLAKDITSVFKLFYKKGGKYHTKGKMWSGIKTFWNFRIAVPSNL